MGVVPFRSKAMVETIGVHLVEDRSVPRVARATRCTSTPCATGCAGSRELAGCSLESTEAIMEMSFALASRSRKVMPTEG